MTFALNGSNVKLCFHWVFKTSFTECIHQTSTKGDEKKLTHSKTSSTCQQTTNCFEWRHSSKEVFSIYWSEKQAFAYIVTNRFRTTKMECNHWLLNGDSIECNVCPPRVLASTLLIQNKQFNLRTGKDVKRSKRNTKSINNFICWKLSMLHNPLWFNQLK